MSKAKGRFRMVRIFQVENKIVQDALVGWGFKEKKVLFMNGDLTSCYKWEKGD